MPTTFSIPVPSSAARDAENETREKLIAVAGTLFALHGYRGVSVRAIAAAAGVNWSLVGYYFRGKEGLLFEVYRRQCEAIKAERSQLLKAAKADSQPPQLEKVIEVFVLPALSVVQPQAGGASFSRLCVMLAAENSKLLDRLAKNFNASDVALIDALCECLPALSRDEVFWRFHYMIGTIYYTAMDPERIKDLSKGRCDPANVSENAKRLIPFLAAGFRAPASLPPVTAPGKKNRTARRRVT
jgi:AcrR family transcriptional regulator